MTFTMKGQAPNRETMTPSQSCIDRPGPSSTAATEHASVKGLIHDLVQSATATKGWVTILRKNADDPDSYRQLSRRLAALAASVTQTELLLGQAYLLLDTHDETQILRCRPTDIVNLVYLVANDVSIVSHRRITVSAAAPTLIGDWDPVQLDRVIRNLLQNAAQYSPSGSEITIAIRTTSHDQSNGDDSTDAIVTVHNEGSSICQLDLPRVFDLFYRGPEASDAAQGWGIGLTVVKEIVALHGGDVTVDSHEGAGATFTIRLPVHRH